jgi:hypothetical protein
MADEINKSKDNEDHPDFPGLTYGDVRKAREKAEVSRLAEKKTAALLKIEEQHLQELRAADGETDRNRALMDSLTPVERELVDITLNLAPQMDAIRINGTIYHDRGTFTVPRAVAREMKRIEFEGWRHESVRLGEDTYAFYSKQNRNLDVVNTRASLLGGRHH